MHNSQESNTIKLRPDRQRGLAGKISAARARRNAANLTREDFLDDQVPDAPGALEQTHKEFRMELRRIISEDAERAANAQDAPNVTAPEDATPKRSGRSRLKTLRNWLACLLGIGGAVYLMSRAG